MHLPASQTHEYPGNGAICRQYLAIALFVQNPPHHAQSSLALQVSLKPEDSNLLWSTVSWFNKFAI